MENNELFQTIEQLKVTLSDVASAREQVSETVKAYGQTQTEIRSYIGNLNQIETAISSLIALLQNNKVVVDQQSTNAVNNLKSSCDTILNQAKNEFAATSQRFTDDTQRSLSTMSTQIERFDRSIDKANTLTNKVESTSKEVSHLIDSVKSLQDELVDSQKSQDDAIDNISKKQDETNVSLSKQNGVLAQQRHAIEALGVSLDSLRKLIEDLKTSLANESAQISKGINTNRWLIITAFIILAVLQYLFK